MDIVLADLKIGDRDLKALMHAPKNGFFYVIDRATGKLVSAEPFADVDWATHVDLETGRPVEVDGLRYESGIANIMPGPWGAHSWHAMSFSPDTGLVYIPTLHMKLGFDDQGIDREGFQSVPFRGGALTPAGMPAFGDLTDAEVESLRHYVRREAEAALAQQAAAGN